MGSEYKKIHLSEKILSCIQNEKPNIAIKNISNMERSNGNKIGNDYALKYYISGADNSVNYEPEKYRNNVTKFRNQINKNIAIAKKSIN